jgi:nucleoside-diphosphate-sugar epimerase
MFLSPDTSARTGGDVLITGATGFLGMELMARLLEDGDRRVWALVRAPDQATADLRVRETLASLVPDPESYAERVQAVAESCGWRTRAPARPSPSPPAPTRPASVS